MSQDLSITESLRLLSDETRVRILHLLTVGEFSAGEITEALGMNPSAVSNQLALLKKSGLAESRKEGTRVFYRPARKPLLDKGLMDRVFEQGAGEGLFASEENAVASIMEARRRSSLEYFETLTETDPAPGESAEPLLDGMMRLMPVLKLADLGCGRGELASRLAAAGHRITGIDNSRRRIEEAQALHTRPDGPEFRVADMEHTGLESGTLDGVILSHSLHHAPDPGKVLAEGARLLKKGGILLIIDLVSHGHEEFRQIWGDLWLGFDPGELSRLLGDTGLVPAEAEIRRCDTRFDDIGTLILSARKD